MVESGSCRINRRVAGSSPARGAKVIRLNAGFFVYIQELECSILMYYIQLNTTTSILDKPITWKLDFRNITPVSVNPQNIIFHFR